MKTYLKWFLKVCLTLIISISIPMSIAEAAVNHSIGSKFSLYVTFIFQDPVDASNNCFSLSGKWANLQNSKMTVKNANGKVIGISNSRSWQRIGVNSTVYNAMVAAGIRGVKTYMTSTQCALGISVDKLSSSEKVFKASIPGFGSWTFSKAEAAANFENGSSNFEVLLG